MTKFMVQLFRFWPFLATVSRLMSIWCLGPESGELQLQPWAETAEPMKALATNREN
jgi:hypothetical protein